MGFFPLDHQLKLGHHSWTPETIGKAIRLGVEIPSLRRAAEEFEGLTHVPLSKSSLQVLVLEYGGRLATQREEAAELLTAPCLEPGDGHAPVTPPAAGEVMAVSMDGVMVNIRDEGWKEARTGTVSVVERSGEGEEAVVRLTQHSYCAGLWDANTFGRQQWAEAWRRGIQKAHRVVAVNDGAAWIWTLVATYFAPCVEIIDWWHAAQRIWEITFSIFDQGTEQAAQWGAELKQFLWAGDLRALLHALRHHWPRGRELPETLRHAVGYLFRQRHRMHYRSFREEGNPIGSGTVESACKVVVQERMVQAGMRWSRPGLRAMLALRSELLSQRWDATWSTLTQPVT